MRSFACSDPKHIGDRLIDARRAYELRLEARMLVGQSGRKDMQIVSVICRDCVDWRMDEIAGRARSQQSSMLFGADLREP